MRPPSLAFLLLVAAAPAAAQGVAAGSSPLAGVTWSGPTPACRLDRCGPNVKRACLLGVCAPDSARSVTVNRSLVATESVLRLLPASALRADSTRRQTPAPRPRR